MLCTICQKNEAVVTYTEVVNGIKNEKHICHECAKKYTGLGQTPFVIGTGNFLSSLLASVLGQNSAGTDCGDMKKTNLICPNCGMTYNEFLKYSKYGCADCFKTFSLILEPYLKKIQGSCEHTGKMPYNMKETVILPKLDEAPDAPVKEQVSEIELLREQLSQAIKAEAYEDAARLRDQIREIEKGAEQDEEVV